MRNSIDDAIAARREQEHEERESRWRRDAEQFAKFPRMDTHRSLSDAAAEARSSGLTLVVKIDGIPYLMRPSGSCKRLYERMCGAVVVSAGTDEA